MPNPHNYPQELLRSFRLFHNLCVNVKVVKLESGFSKFQVLIKVRYYHNVVQTTVKYRIYVPSSKQWKIL